MDPNTLEYIKQRIKKLKQKYLSKYYRKYFSVLPENCQHNHQQDVLRTSNGNVYVDADSKKPVRIGICLYGVDNPEEWKGDFCFEKETAENCSVYKNKYSKKQINQKFEKELQNKETRVEKYKDIHELINLLDENQIDLSLDLKEDLQEILKNIDYSELEDNTLSSMKKNLEKELHQRNLEEPEVEIDLNEYIESLDESYLRKLAQGIIKTIQQKSSENGTKFKKAFYEKLVWEDEFSKEEEHIRDINKDLFPEGL